MKLLLSKEDFHWYKAGIDAGGKYAYKHIGEPEKYPCVVESEFRDDPNGPYTYTHEFVYRQDEKCEKCGHMSSIWPESVKTVIK